MIDGEVDCHFTDLVSIWFSQNFSRDQCSSGDASDDFMDLCQGYVTNPPPYLEIMRDDELSNEGSIDNIIQIKPQEVAMEAKVSEC